MSVKKSKHTADWVANHLECDLSWTKKLVTTYQMTYLIITAESELREIRLTAWKFETTCDEKFDIL